MLTALARRSAATLVITLALLGAASGVMRATFPSTLGVRAERIRAELWRAFDVQESDATLRRAQVTQFEGRFASNRWSIAFHAAGGALFLLAGCLQFSERIRTRHINLHRWNGRLLVAVGLLVAANGMYFGIVIPAAGVPEALIISIAGSWFMFSMVKGVFAIRRKDMQRHRRWMIRAFAVAAGISVVRIVGLIADVTMAPRGWTLENIFVVSLAAGWALSVVAAEVWMSPRIVALCNTTVASFSRAQPSSPSRL